MPLDSECADRISSVNYDEFQGDHEIWEAIRAEPESVLSVTMAHCAVESPDAILRELSEEALAAAKRNMARLRGSPRVREMHDVSFVYEIEDPQRPGVRQIGLGGMIPTGHIATDHNSHGTVIRNEGVREYKARGRATVIEATQAIIGAVNMAVPDREGRLLAALLSFADGRTPDYEAAGTAGTTHRIWILAQGEGRELRAVLDQQPEAYVSDGNHRSAAVCMLGAPEFLGVYFPASTQTIQPYNRLVSLPAGDAWAQVEAALGDDFRLVDGNRGGPYQPKSAHRTGLYTSESGWREATVSASAWDVPGAAASIDHAVVQRTLFSRLGIEEEGDPGLTFVGANKDAAWLQQQVDAGRAGLAVTLPAVTMDQFIAVCRQRKMMPPKSTWFEPKIRAGLVTALL